MLKNFWISFQPPHKDWIITKSKSKIPIINPVATMKNPKSDLTFASTATANKIKKLESNKIFSIIEFTSLQPNRLQ